jgi:hypothetical protein
MTPRRVSLLVGNFADNRERSIVATEVRGLRDALGCLLFAVVIVVAVLLGLRELFWEVATELIGWSLLAAIALPGSLIAAALDHFTALDRGQLWTLSIFFSVLMFIALGALLDRVRSADEIVLWYPALVASLLLVLAVLFFGFKIRWIGSFMARFAFGPELFDMDRWIPVVIQVVLASGMMLTGLAVMALGWATTVTLSRIQIWLLAVVLNVMAGAAIGAWGRRRRWELFTPSHGSVDRFDEVTFGTLHVLTINMLATLLGCLLYFGCRVVVLGTLFLRMAPQWPDWLK